MATKILSIDDEPALLNLFRAALNHKGYDVFTADNVDEGLRMLEQNDMALIMLDVRMRERSGLTVYRELRRRRNTPVLFVTGDATAFSDEANADSGLWQREIECGNADILYKPFNIQTLYDKVESLISRSTPAAP